MPPALDDYQIFNFAVQKALEELSSTAVYTLASQGIARLFLLQRGRRERSRDSRERAPVYALCEPQESDEVAHQQLQSIFCDKLRRQDGAAKTSSFRN